VVKVPFAHEVPFRHFDIIVKQGAAEHAGKGKVKYDLLAVITRESIDLQRQVYYLSIRFSD
jgi:hypothetical protein